MCRDNTHLVERLPDRQAYLERQKRIREQHRGDFLTVRLVRPDQAVVMVEFEKEEIAWNCRKKVVSIRIGKDLESVQREIDEWVRTNPRLFRTSPRRIFERAPVLGTVARQGSPITLEGVEFTSLDPTTEGAGRLVVIQARNTRENESVVIGLFKKSDTDGAEAGQPVNEYRLGPGEQLTMPLRPPGDYWFAIRRIEPGSADERPNSTIRWVRELIRAQVTKQGHITRTTLTTVGTRG